MLLTLIPLIASSQDLNWYILRQMGYNSNDSSYSNLIDSPLIKIHGEEEVEVDTLEEFTPRNDVFIIFDDSSCYSSRPHDRIANGFKALEFLNFQGNDLYVGASGNRKIAYMYWTNVYDNEDEPPSDRVIEPWTDGGGQLNPLIMVDILEVDSMFAHQDIVAGKDIILVVPRSKEARVLQYNLIDGYTVDILEENTAIFPNSSSSLGGGTSHHHTQSKILIQPSMVPTYIAFKARTDIINYMDEKHTWILYNYETSEVLDVLSEAIRGAHDPNFVYLYNVCKLGDDLYANYMIHFHNDGTAPVSTVSMSFKQNNDLFRFRQAGVHSLGGKFGGGYNCENLFFRRVGNWVVSSFFPSRVTYLFKKDNAGIKAGRTPEQQQITSIRPGSTGYFLLCLKLEVGIARSWPNVLFYHDLRLREPKVYFDGNGFDITAFKPYDRFNPKKYRIVLSEACSPCNCDNVPIPDTYLLLD